MAEDDDEGKFAYTDPRTGKSSMRSLNPNFWETTKERVVDSAEVDKQRERAKTMKATRYQTVNKRGE